jgi:hypothetical protein
MNSKSQVQTTRRLMNKNSRLIQQDIQRATIMNSMPNGSDPAVMDAIERGNAVVFIDLAMGANDDQAVPLGRIKLELFVKDVRVS